MKKKETINIYVEIDGGVMQAVYVDKASDKKFDICINKMDYDDLAAEADDPEGTDYKETKKEFNRYERDVEKGRLVSVW